MEEKTKVIGTNRFLIAIAQTWRTGSKIILAGIREHYLAVHFFRYTEKIQYSPVPELLAMYLYFSPVCL